METQWLFFRANAPRSNKPSLPTDAGRIERTPTSVKFIDCGNHRFWVDAEGLEDIRVIGGNVWNGAEAELSRILMRNRTTVRIIVYLPDDTKGGMMIRPHYHHVGDRAARVEFPALESVTLSSDGVGIFCSTYSAPRLKELRIMFQTGTVVKEEHVGWLQELVGPGVTICIYE